MHDRYESIATFLKLGGKLRFFFFFFNWKLKIPTKSTYSKCNHVIQINCKNQGTVLAVGALDSDSAVCSGEHVIPDPLPVRNAKVSLERSQHLCGNRVLNDLTLQTHAVPANSSFFCPSPPPPPHAPVSALPAAPCWLHRAVPTLGPAARLGGGLLGPQSLSKAGGGDREGGWRGRGEVEQLQHGYAHAAAPSEHAGGRHPLVAAWIIFLNGVQAGAAVVAAHRIEPAVHGHQIMGAPVRPVTAMTQEDKPKPQARGWMRKLPPAYTKYSTP